MTEYRIKPVKKDELDKIRILSDSEVLEYLESEGFPQELYRCSSCGNLINYPSNLYYFSKFDKRPPKNLGFGKLRGSSKKSIFGIHEINGHQYHLRYCGKCAAEIDPDYSSKITSNTSQTTKVLYGISDEDFNVAVTNLCSHTKDSFIRKYGESEGLSRWNEYRRKQAETNSFEYKKKQYGWSADDFLNYNKSRAVTLDNMIARYGQDEGVRKFDEYQERQRYTVSLEYFKERYGDEQGTEIYRNFCEKRRESSKRALANRQRVNYSKIADEFFQKLCDRFPDHEIYTHCLNSEYNVGYYNPDFYDRTAGIIVEFYGDFWHANPAIYEADSSLHPVILSPERHLVNVGDLWDHDQKRQTYIISKLKIKPDHFVIVWQSDYMNDKAGTFDRIVRLIENSIANGDHI